jgi:hypothetical protein
MSSALERRLAAVERRVMPSSRKPRVIIFRGGIESGDPACAVVGGQRLERERDETFEAFQSRAVAAAARAGEPYVLIGALT